MNIELYVAIMAGVVLSLFLMVSEIVFLRKRVAGIRKRMEYFYQSGKYIKFFLSIFAIAAFFLIQPLIVGALVVMALDNLNPHFSSSVIREIRQVLMSIIG
jgi:hypothetical protein